VDAVADNVGAFAQVTALNVSDALDRALGQSEARIKENAVILGAIFSQRKQITVRTYPDPSC
jgi:hypothetical protein